jgi:hypothetical protein
MAELLELRLKSLDEQNNIPTLPTEGPLSRSEKFAGMPAISAIQSKLLKADFHGAHLIGKFFSPSCFPRNSACLLIFILFVNK